MAHSFPSGSTARVTGAASGIGYAIAQFLAASGDASAWRSIKDNIAMFRTAWPADLFEILRPIRQMEKPCR